MEEKKRILTGDRPTGKLHLGHYVGSIKNRVRLQDEYDCYFIIADLHTLTTKPSKEDILSLRGNIKEMVLDYLSCGVDPEKSTIYLQSATRAVYQLNLIFSMLTSVNHLSGIPSLKEMAKSAHMNEEQMPYGLLGYPVLQTADILMCKSHLVPIGKDNLAHIELSRDIAKRFNALYGDFFPVPEGLLSETPSLIGTDGKAKMSKSLNNTIFLSDDVRTVEKKVKGMYTDPNRVRADIPGSVENNPVFIYHDIFNPDVEEVNDLKERYQKGKVGDVEVKEKLAKAINSFLEPLREKRAAFAKQKGLVEHIIFEGTQKVIELSDQVTREAFSLMGLLGSWKKIVKEAEKFSKN
jgi:tryptophanyl-tRNA synthetase